MGNTTSGNKLYTHYPSNFPCKQIEETGYSNLTSLKNCVSSIEGKESNSTSPTDIYILESNSKKYFMKVFVTSVDTSEINDIIDTGGKMWDIKRDKKILNSFEPLIYEYGIYLGKINTLVKYNICPFFVTTKGGSLTNTKDDMINFLETKLYNSSKTNKLIKDEIKENFVRNIWIIINNILTAQGDIGSTKVVIVPKLKRPSISEFVSDYFITNNIKIKILENSANTLGLPRPLNDNFKFGYFITESFDNPITIKQTMYDVSQFNINLDLTNATQLNIFQRYNDISYLFMFQIALGYKALEISKIVNCDLHTDNILCNTTIKQDDITDISKYNNLISKNNFYTFSVEKKLYNINLPFLIKIFDFDRSYLYGDKTPETEMKNHHFTVHPFYNSSNLRDFLFTTCYNVLYLMELIESTSENSNDNKCASELLNNYTSIIIKNPNINIDDIEIYMNDKNNLSTRIQKLYRNSIIDDYKNNSNYQNLTNRSKSYLCFLSNLFFRLKQEGQDDLKLRNKYINDKTFDTGIFYSITEIIDNIYININPSFKTIPTCNDNDCIIDDKVTKCYLSEYFMDAGILNKDKYYKYVNDVYKKPTVSRNNEIQQKDNTIENKNKEIKTKDKEIKTKDNIIKQKKEEIEQQNEEIEQQNKEIEQQNEEIEQQNKEIEQQNNTIKQKDFVIGKRDAKIQQKDNDITERDLNIREKDLDIQKKDRENRQLQEMIKEVTEKLEKMKKEKNTKVINLIDGSDDETDEDEDYKEKIKKRKFK